MTSYGRRSTADDVLADLDLSGRTYLVTGCAAGIGLESARALAARGAHVVGTARSLDRARSAEATVRGRFTPIACDQNDFASVAQAVHDIHALGLRLDGIVANAGIMAPAAPDLRYGVESQFRVNHLSHMLLVTRIADLLADGTGRLVMVSSSAIHFARRGIALDDLDAHRGYAPMRFYGQSKLANLAFAKSMAERLSARGVTANAIHPGVIPTTELSRSLTGVLKLIFPLGVLFGKTIAQGAATQCWAVAHPDMAGRSGGFYADCRPVRGSRFADDATFRSRLWSRSEAILAEHAPSA